MPTDDAPLTLLRVWREMSPDQRAAAARSFWLDRDSLPQQAEAVTYLARQLRFRPQSILSLPVERRTRQLAMAQKPPEGVIGRALVVYHLDAQRPMLEMFLSQLGIANENGLITESLTEPPSDAQLQKAVAAVAADFSAEDVRLYWRTLAVQDPDTWGRLAAFAGSAPP